MITIQVSTPSADRLIPIVTEATTWGELKEDLLDAGINTEGMKGVIRETRNNLEVNEALLPTTDFTLFLFTAKIKSGLDHAAMLRDLRDKMQESYNEIIYNLEDGAYDDGEENNNDISPTLSALQQERKRLEEELGFN